MPVTPKHTFEQEAVRANMALSILEFFLNAKRKFNQDEPDIMVPQEVIELEVAAAKVLQNFLTP